MRTLYDLMVHVAQHLSGKKNLTIRLRKPHGTQGTCRKDSSGVLTIDIEPELEEKRFMYVFLHEVAHARFERFKAMELEVSELVEVELTPKREFQEVRADKVAKAWLQYAEQNRDLSFSYQEGCLWSLLNLQPGGST